MPNTMPITKVIDPTQLSEENSRLLSQFLAMKKEQQNLFVKDKETPAFLIDPYDGKTKEYSIKLTHSILHRTRARNSKEDRYEVISNDEPIGQGQFGVVINIDCTLEPRDDFLFAKRHKFRVVKIEMFDKDAQYKLFQEYSFAKKIKTLGAKEPIAIVGRDGVHGFSVMHKLKGMTLADLLEKIDNDEIKFSVEERFRLTTNLIKTLQYIHDKGIVHNDIKPENIFYDPEYGDVYIFDFGLSIDIHQENKNKSVGGTPEFAAPERFSGSQKDPKSDNYSLGIVLAMLWNADPPQSITQEGSQEESKVEVFLYQPTNLGRDLPFGPQVQTDLKKIVQGLLKEDPGERSPLNKALKEFVGRILIYNVDAGKLDQTEDNFDQIFQANQQAKIINQELMKKDQLTLALVKDLLRNGMAQFNEVGNAFNQFVMTLDINVLRHSQSKSDMQIKIDEIISKYESLKQNVAALIAQAKDKNLILELSYWLDKLNKCPANLDLVSKLSNRVAEELNHWNKMFGKEEAEMKEKDEIKKEEQAQETNQNIPRIPSSLQFFGEAPKQVVGDQKPVVEEKQVLSGNK